MTGASLTAAAATPAAFSAPGDDYKPGRAVMKAGCQRGSADADLALLARSGVKHCCGYPELGQGGGYTIEAMQRLLDRGKKHGVEIMMIQLPLPSSAIERAQMPSIMMGKPDRDRDIDKCCEIIRACAKAGIASVKYNMSILGVLSTEPVTGRGGTTARSWDYAAAKQEPALTEAGLVPGPVAWERITYFLNRVVPVAHEYKVRMACHPHDPGVPPRGFRGVDRVLGTVDGLKKFISI